MALSLGVGSIVRVLFCFPILSPFCKRFPSDFSAPTQGAGGGERSHTNSHTGHLLLLEPGVGVIMLGSGSRCEKEGTIKMVVLVVSAELPIPYSLI